MDMCEKPGPDRKWGDNKVLQAIKDIYGPAAGTSEIADRLDVERQTVDRYLRKLAEENLVHTRIIGQTRVWWLSEEAKKQLAGAMELNGPSDSEEDTETVKEPDSRPD